ncbi:MAG TPA: riboflavin synthase [Terriglobales bacterium]|nr:riboflavin synthase [Terriglobales bacterium]
MFTGLVQETGKIESLRSTSHGTRISITAKGVARELKKGDSVAVSGVCLTAVEIGRGRFSADLAEETLSRTSLGKLRKGSLVNLELPARPQDRLGGHIVQGHVDGTGELIILEKIAGGDDWRLTAKIPSELSKYVVPQGSITIEGISLTVAKIEGAKLEIAIIPHTYQGTNLKALRPGDLLNIEVDVLAKYVERLTSRESAQRLSVEELMQRGF